MRNVDRFNQFLSGRRRHETVEPELEPEPRPAPEREPTSEPEAAANQAANSTPTSSTATPPSTNMCRFQHGNLMAEFELNSVTPQMLSLQFQLENLHFSLNRRQKVFTVKDEQTFVPPLSKIGTYKIAIMAADSHEPPENENESECSGTPKNSPRRGASQTSSVSIYRNLENKAEQHEKSSVSDWQRFAPEDVPWLEITNDDGDVFVATNVQHSFIDCSSSPLQAEKYFVVHPKLSPPGHIFNKPAEAGQEETPLRRAFLFLPPYLFVAVRVLSVLSRKKDFPQLEPRGREPEAGLFYPHSLDLSLSQLTHRVNDVFKRFYRLLYEFDQLDKLESPPPPSVGWIGVKSACDVLSSIESDLEAVMDKLLLALEDGDEVLDVAKEVLRQTQPNLRGIEALLRLEHDTHLRLACRAEDSKDVAEDLEEYQRILRMDDVICPEATEIKAGGHVLRAARTRKDLKRVHLLMQTGCTSIYNVLEVLEFVMQVLENFYAQCRKLHCFLRMQAAFVKCIDGDACGLARLEGMREKYVLVLRTFSNLVKRKPLHLKEAEPEWAESYEKVQAMQHMLEVLFVKPRGHCH